MKRTHIIAMLIIALSIGAILSSLSDASTYSDFSEAFANKGTEYHIVGKLDKSHPAVYEPVVNPDLFSFYLNDTKGIGKKVILHKSKPQDFERSEQIVLIGKAEGDEFHASEMLLKCPSKYTDTEEALKKSSSFEP